jgi:hypothetical protein
MAVNNTRIKITFIEELVASDFISFDLSSSAFIDVLIKVMSETWQPSRLTKNTVPVAAIPSINTDAFNYSKSFNLDYNSVDQFDIQYSLNSVEIQVNNVFFYLDNLVTNVPDKIIVEFGLPVAFNEFKVDSSSIGQAVDNCNNVKYSMTANVNIKKYILDGTEYIVDNALLEIDYPRGEEFRITLIDEHDQEIYFPTQTTVSLFPKPSILDYWLYDKLLEQNITANVSPSLNGGTVQINVVDIDGLVLEYSLDNTTYTTSNIFTGQANGDYIAYVKDQFNCIKQKSFSVTSLGTRPQHVSISEANSINFVEVETIDDVTIFKNDVNSFNVDGLEEFKYSDNTIFNKKDTPVIQIKCNYSTIAAKLRYEDESEYNLVIAKRSNNLSKYEKLDCVYYKHKSGKLGIYFNSGDVYDQLDVVTGQYELNGNLPLFAKIGNYVDVGPFGVLKVYSVLLDSDINKKIILFDQVYDGITTISTAASLYDLLNFEIYEIELDLNVLASGLYDIVITASDPNYDEVVFVSENMDIQEYHEYSVPIIYNNNVRNNRDIFYKYNIKNFIRVFYSDIDGYFKEESELNIGDNSASSVKSMMNGGDRWLFEELNKKRMQTLAIALSCEHIFISGIGYLKDESLTIDKIKNTNTYSIQASMIKSGVSYSTKDSGYSGSDELNEELYVPKLLVDGINLIKL